KLDIEKINVVGALNFLGAEVNKESNRETFRIIKQAFDSTGNYLEAHKFYSFEMDRMKVESSGFTKLIYRFNQFGSSFGQNYTYSLAWMIVLTLVFACMVSAKSFYIDETSGLYSYALFLNQAASHFPLFAKSFPEGIRFIGLIYSVLMSALIWLFVVAIKRHTTR
ncbi:MAG: hypothetical protein GXO35_05180, partial [Gammaproteobacteria bacterium]|nr:hypothetical protein [Gammaproteobacteria bacterium]